MIDFYTFLKKIDIEYSLKLPLDKIKERATLLSYNYSELLDTETQIRAILSTETDKKLILNELGVNELNIDKMLINKNVKENTKMNYFVNREEEIQKIYLHLNRKIKNNIMIIGKAGTGKSTLIDIYEEKYKGNILKINMSEVISETKYRGEFEKKLLEIIKGAMNENTIIFIDEIHTIFNTGSKEGGISATDILKPLITNPNIRIIGATTEEEYLVFSTDSAIKRRFNVIKIKEPSFDILLQISKNIASLYNEHLEESMIHLILNKLSNDKYKYKYFPDKLIDFLDFSFSYKKLYSKDFQIDHFLNKWGESY